MVKKILILAFCILSLNSLALHSAEVFAQNEVLELPTVHILPDNPLYFLKTLKEKVQLLVTRNTSDQTSLLLNFSQKRLAEAQKVAEKGKIHISEKLLEAFGKDIETAQQKINEAKNKGEQTRDLVLKLQETIAFQKSVIEKLQGLGEPVARSYIPSATPSAVPYDKMERRPGITDWLRSLFGKKEILSPLVR